MSPEVADGKSGTKPRLLDRLHDPAKLRVLVTVVVLAVGYFGIYIPLSGDVAEAIDHLHRERKLTELASTVEHLRTQYQTFQGRLPKQADTKEWVKYVLDGIRRFPVKLNKLNCDVPQNVGPYKAVVLRVDIEGEYSDIDKFLRWLDSNQRLFRADSVSITLGQGKKGGCELQLTILGVMG